MSMLSIKKKLDKLNKPKHECTSHCTHGRKLREAKADTQKLIDFAGQDLADRFILVKSKLKAPENDLYYWIKNKSVEELEQTIIAAEGTESNTKAKKAVSEAGAELVCDTAHWKVYHITTFAASQKYGRDSKWCITGINNYGDHYWKDYTNRGIKFYFAIAKQDYDPRGTDSKFAFAVFPDNAFIELYNQVDERAVLYDIPHYEEINIPGVDLDDIKDVFCFCDECGRELDEDSYYITPDGEYCCENCFYRYYNYCETCGEACCVDDLYQTIIGDSLCVRCYDEFMETDNGYAASLLVVADDGPSYFDGYTPEEANKMIQKMASVWRDLKAKGYLYLAPEEIQQAEEAFIDTVKEMGLEVDLGSTSEPTLKCIAETNIWKIYHPTTLADCRNIGRANRWTDEDMDDSELQCWFDETVYDNGKVYLIMSKRGRPEGYSSNDVGAYFLHITSDGSFDLQEDNAFWCTSYPSIKGLEDVDIEGFRFPKADADGMFYTQEGEHRVFRGGFYQVVERLKSYSIKPGTTKIGYDALIGADNLETLTIPDSVVEISDYGIPEETESTDYKVICKKNSYAETYCKNHSIPVQIVEHLRHSRTKKLTESFSAPTNFAKEFKAFENMWD